MRASFSRFFALRFSAAAAIATLLFLFVLRPAPLHAQSTGTLTGTVFDQSGAAVPNASVVLINEASRGDQRKSVTSSTGYFSFATVPPATYTLKVTASGFQTWQGSGISVRPGDVRNVPNISLQVGAAEQTVQVTENADEVAPVDSGERSAVITSRQLSNLSLEGRDATELIRILPGFAAFNGGSVANQAQDFTTISPTGGAVGQGYVGNGSPYRSGTDLVSDGAHIIDNGCNCGATQTVNGDMVSEVKVQTSNFGADSAKGPVVVNAVGKSGGSNYHGEAYLHARDHSMNALDWSFKNQLVNDQTHLLKAPADRYLFPGGNFGGPVPGTHKKLVFWSGFEYYYQHGFPMSGLSVPGLEKDIVPTLSMRKGIFDPTAPDNAKLCAVGSNASQPFCQSLGSSHTWANAAGVNQTGNIPTTAFDPGGAYLMGMVPAPNADPTATGGYNLLVPENLDQNGWMFRTRVDYSFSDNNKMYVTYNTQKETDQSPIHLWWTPPNSIPFPGGMSSHDDSQTISGHYVRVFSPTLTNDFSGGLAYINYPLVRNDPNAWSVQGYPYKNVFNTKTTMAPDLSNGYWVAGVPFMDQADIFTAGGGSFVWKKWNLSFEDNLTKTFKSHTIKTGFYYERTVNDQGSFAYPNGEFGTSPYGPFSCLKADLKSTYNCGSNNPIANILLGVTGYGSYTQWNASPLDNLWYPTMSGYAQDDWKITKRLTLNLGLRGDHLGAWVPTAGNTGVAAFTGNLSNSTLLPGFDWHGRNSAIPLAGRNVNAITWEPRFGFAFDLYGEGKTVVRGGWGEYGYRDQWNDYANAVETANGVRKWSAPGTISLATINAIGAAGGISGNAGLPSSGFGVDIHDHNQPLTRSYNLTLSQRAPWNSLVEIGYVGNQTIHQPLEGDDPRSLQNLNFVSIGGAFKPGASSNYPNGCSTPPCDVGNLNNNVVYPFASAYANNTVKVLRHLGESNYNALQTSWVKQTGHFIYNFNYTWSKVLGTLGTAQLNGLAIDGTNIKNDYGVMNIDRSHVFNFSYTIQEGNPLKTGNGFLNYVANGWNISGIATWQSGANLQALVSSNFGLGGNGPIDPVTGNAIGISSTNYVGSPNMNLQPLVTCDPRSNLGSHQYVNGACFTVPTGGQQGTLHFPYIHGPAFSNEDLALFKTFKVRERQNLEFRASAFNFLNHPLWSFDPNQNSDLTMSFNYVCSGAGSCTNGKGKYVLQNAGAPANPGDIKFGYAPTKYGRRVMELSLKYTF